MEKLSIVDIRNRLRCRSTEGGENFAQRSRYEKQAESALNSGSPSRIITVIEYGIINNDRLGLDTMCRLFDALYECGTESQIRKYGNIILKEYVSKVRDAKETQTYLKRKLGNAKSKLTTKVQNNFDDIKNSFNNMIQSGKMNAVNNISAAKNTAAKVFPHNPVINKSKKENAYIQAYENMLETATKIVSIDRILENYNRISKRFNIDKIIQENTPINGISDTIVELCNLIDTYDMPVKARYNTCLETVWYGFHKNSFTFDESELVTTVTDYYMSHGKNGIACASILESSVVFDKKDYLGDMEVLTEEEPEESVLEGNMGSFYRVTYNGIGIYEAFKNACTHDEWRSFKNSDAVKWLPTPKVYGRDPNHISYFTELGYSKFKKNTYPIIAQKLDKNNIKVDKVMLSIDPIYSDLYQVVVPNIKRDTTSESSVFTEDGDYIKKIAKEYEIKKCLDEIRPKAKDIVNDSPYKKRVKVLTGCKGVENNGYIRWCVCDFADNWGPQEDPELIPMFDKIADLVRDYINKNNSKFELDYNNEDDDFIYISLKVPSGSINEVKFINDKGDKVPKTCPKCGAKVGVFFRGEPVFLCSNKDCEKYFGTVPFKEASLQTKISNTINKNDPISQKAVDIKFYDKGTQIGEASISAIDTNNAFLYNVEVFKPYRGKGYSHDIMKYCLSHYNINELTVESNNKIAINLYKKYGFKEIKHFDENGKDMIDMKINPSIKESCIRIIEAKLSSKDRAKLKDSDYGIPSKKKYPMPDESHVRSAIQMFNHVEKEDEAELAKNIKRKIKQYGMSVNVGKDNRFSKYYTSHEESAIIQNQIREAVTGNAGYIYMHEETDFNKILNDFKASNEDKKETKLKALVSKLYTNNVENIVEGTPNLLKYIRVFFIIGSFAIPVVGPIAGVITFIADRFLALHMDRQNTEKMRTAFQNEIRATDKKINSTKNNEEKNRLEEYKKSLVDAYDKIDEYYEGLLNDEELDEKYDRDDDSDIKGSAFGDFKDEFGNDFDFDFDDNDDFDMEGFEEAVRFIPIMNKLSEEFELSCPIKYFDKDKCHKMLTVTPSIVKDLGDVSMHFNNIIDPAELQNAISDIKSDITIGNVRVNMVERYDLQNTYHDLTRIKNKEYKTGDIFEEARRFATQIEIIRALNEIYSSCIYYSPITEASFTNSLKLASEKIKSAIQKMSDKDREISEKIDVGVNNVKKSAERALDSDNREAVIKGSVLPSASKLIKLTITNAALGILINPAVAVIGTLGYLALAKGTRDKQKRAILDEIEIELKMCQKYIDLAESKNDLKALKKLYTIQRNLERQRAKIKYNLQIKGEKYHDPGEFDQHGVSQ